MDKIYFSANKKIELETELEMLTTIERSKVAKEIEDAKSHGDLSENAEYHAARERQAKIEDRINEIEYKLKNGSVVATNGTDVVSIGHTVQVKNKKTDKETTYQIVGEEEQDVMQGKISHTSPIATNLLGKSVGESAVIKIPSGELELEIISISQ